MSDWDKIKTSDATDFLGLTPKPGFKPPSLQNRNPLVQKVPEVDDLYRTQDNLLRMIQALNQLEEANPDIHWEGLERHMRQTYKGLRSWLERNG